MDSNHGLRRKLWLVSRRYKMYYQRPKPVGRKLSLAEWKRINRRDKKTLVEHGRSRAILGL